MEKIVNLQASAGGSAASAVSRRSQTGASEAKDDFIRLLQQQKESAKQPEDTKETKKDQKIDDVKADEKQPEAAVEEPVEEKVDPEDELLELAQLELQLQQNLLQQSIVQNAEPETEEVLTAVDVSAAEEVPAVTFEAASVETEPVTSALLEQPKTEALKTEEQTAPVPAEAAQPEQKPEQVQAAFAKNQGENSEAKGELRDTRTPAAEKQEPVRMESAVENPAADAGASAQVQTAEAPVESQRPEEPFGTKFQSQETQMKSTVEDLPQELGKAVMPGKAGDSQTLTVELEPVSLGKLTIRLEYEEGRTLVSVMASNPKTLELLNEKATEIAAILKDRTGEETVIYTEEPQREPGEEANEQENRGGQPREHKEQKEEQRSQTESFVQQLRLGLV